MNAIGFDPSLQIPPLGASPYGFSPLPQSGSVVPQSVLGTGNSPFNNRFNPKASFSELGVNPLVPQLNSPYQMNASAYAGCSGGHFNTFA